MGPRTALSALLLLGALSAGAPAIAAAPAADPAATQAAAAVPSVVPADRPAGMDGLLAEHIVILLDASGSMTSPMGEGTDRMDAAKAAIGKVVDGLSGEVRVGLLAFTSASSKEWFHPIGPLDKARFKEGLMSIEADGGTPLGAYLEKAANALLAERQAHEGYGVYRLIVVTDGEAEDAELMDRVAGELLSRGISLDVVGVQMAATHSLSARAHSYREAGSAETLERAISAILAESGGPSGDEAEAYALANALGDSAARALLTSLSEGQRNSPIQASLAGAASGATSASAQAAGSQAGGPAQEEGKSGQWFLMAGVFLMLYLIFRRRGRRGVR